MHKSDPGFTFAVIQAWSMGESFPKMCERLDILSDVVSLKLASLIWDELEMEA